MNHIKFGRLSGKSQYCLVLQLGVICIGQFHRPVICIGQFENENMEDDREEAKRRRGHRKSMYKCVDLHKSTRQQNYETETINKD